MEEKKEVSTETKEEEATVAPGSVKMDILLIISSMQNQNGIRLNDYKRYAHFCRKKIRKLRKIYKLTQGKRKYMKKEITSETLIKSKILLIPILESERNWAYGMYHQQELTGIGEEIKRLRRQIIRKYKRATYNANRIFTLCKQVADTQTQLEAEAYYNLINSFYLIFTRKFDEALNLLKKSANIYEKISEIKDSIETLEYKEKISQIQTSMRLCLYNLSNNKDQIIDVEEFQKSVNVEDIQLSEKFEEIIKKQKELNTNKNENEFEIKYHGFSIPIKNEKLKDLFNKIKEINIKTEKEKDLNKKIGLFQEHQNKIDEIIKIIKKEKADENSNQQGDNFSKIYTNLLGYIEQLRIKKYIQKNISYIQEYSLDYKNYETLTSIFEKDNLKLKVKPQELIKLYDNLLEYQKQLINLEKDNPDQSYQIDLNYKEKVYSCFKVYFAGLFYALNKKYVECYTIMMYFLEKLKDCAEFYELHNLASIQHLKDLNQEFSMYKNYCLFAINNSFVKIEKEKEKSAKMEIEGKKENKKIKCHQYLLEACYNSIANITKSNYDTLQEHTKIAYENYNETLEKNSYNNYTNIVQIPFNTALLPPKPISYDLIYESLDYPNLEAKTKSQSKSLLGRTFGYFWGS